MYFYEKKINKNFFYFFFNNLFIFLKITSQLFFLKMLNLEGGGGFKNRPKALMCYICGREYGTKSLEIHLKTCMQKWEIEESKKPKKDRRPMPRPPKELSNMINKDRLDSREMEKYNEKVFINIISIINL